MDKINNLINQPPPKVVISGDFLEETPKISDTDAGGSARGTGPDILNLEEKVESGNEKTSPQEVELLSPPQVPPDDDKVAMVDMSIEDVHMATPVNNQEEDPLNENNNQARSEDFVGGEDQMINLDDNGNDITEAIVTLAEEPLQDDPTGEITTKRDDLLVVDEE